MDLHLIGKRAVVTGASKGIGRATARLLAEEGCDVVLVSRDAGALEAAAADIRSATNARATSFPADLSHGAEIDRVARDVGPVDILVNNAGAIPAGDLLAVDDARWRAAWDLKVFGYIGLARALYPNVRERRGTIVNVIGSAGEAFDPNYIAGSAGNAALMSFTRALGKSAAKDFVRVVGINPGPVSTDRIETLLRVRAARDLGDAERWREFFAAMPFGRAATPEEIANAVAFLASPRSGYTTGTILTIDGAPS
jgi:NAD(P)-dependent dehydrogenase (short-subunit alcohol dehydrogenase family)